MKCWIRENKDIGGHVLVYHVSVKNVSIETTIQMLHDKCHTIRREKGYVKTPVPRYAGQEPAFEIPFENNMKWLFAKGSFLWNNGIFVVAGEGFFDQCFVRRWSKQTDDRDKHQTRNHSQCAANNGGLEQGRETGTKQHIGDHQSAGKEKANPAGCFCGAFPIQTV